MKLKKIKKKKSHKWWWLLINSQVLVVFLVTTLFFCNFGIQSTARLDSSLGLIFLAGHQLIITVLNPSVWQQSHIYSRDMNHSQSCLHLLLPVTVCFLSVVIVAVPRNPHHTNSWGSDILAVRQKLEPLFIPNWIWKCLFDHLGLGDTEVCLKSFFLLLLLWETRTSA